MTTLHAHFHLRNQQAFQRLLEQSKNALASVAGGCSGGPGASSMTTSPLLASSLGKSSSWSKKSPIAERALAGKEGYLDVNARDLLGRTVLHLACSASVGEQSALEYVKLLLGHPRINPNVADIESGWTPLHRALYTGNIPAAILLVQRADIDVSVKDFEGYTAFDVYNSTVEGTKPLEEDELDLFTWGTNRNALLGVGDCNDRTHPELISIPPINCILSNEKTSSLPIRKRFLPLRVIAANTAKLHTAAVTRDGHQSDEPSSSSNLNVRLCGFGNGGRLGFSGGSGGSSSSQHMQYSLTPVKDAPSTLNSPQPPFGLAESHIVAVALGQDHTLALSASGYVLSWGLNRFSQLGYATEGPSHLQLTPRRIVGPLKREYVGGISACRTASACWTRGGELWTWGTSNGQLGWEERGSVSVLPRRVTSVPGKIICARVGENAIVVLLSSRDVHAFWNGRSFKITFPTQTFPSEIQAYRPPMAQNNAAIAKIAHCAGEDTFAALSSNGEVFTFSLGSPPTGEHVPSSNPGRPQKVWSLRKQFNAVKDVALGVDGTIILCTESGHVFLRSRGSPGPSKLSASGSVKSGFAKVQFIQRVVSVDASPSGAYLALRARVRPTPIELDAPGLAEDMKSIMPFGLDLWTIRKPDWLIEDCDVVPNLIGSAAPNASIPTSGGSAHAASAGTSGTESTARSGEDVEDAGDDDDGEEQAIQDDVQMIIGLIELVERGMRRTADEKRTEHALHDHGANVIVSLDSGFEVPAHKLLLASRSFPLRNALLRLGRGMKDSDGRICLTFHPSATSTIMATSLDKLKVTGVAPLTILLFLTYIYTDAIPCIWDRRIAVQISNRLNKHSPRSGIECIRDELTRLSRLLKLKELEDTLSAPMKRPMEVSLTKHLWSIYQDSQGRPLAPEHPCGPDVELKLSDGTIFAHSTILRARSPFFTSFFGDKLWTQERRRPLGNSGAQIVESMSSSLGAGNCLCINLKHRRLQEMTFVMKAIYEDAGDEMFNILPFTQSADDVLEFLFSVLDIAEELLIERLTQVCAHRILDFLNTSNACALLVATAPYPTRAARQLVHSLHSFLARNLEMFLESRMLDDLPHSLVRSLSCFICEKQVEKMPITRSDKVLKQAMEKWKDWVVQQDWPSVIVRSRKASLRQAKSPRLSPANAKGRRPTLSEPSPPPDVQSLSTPSFGPVKDKEGSRNTSDDIFDMDGIPPISLSLSLPSISGMGLQNSPFPSPRRPPSTPMTVDAGVSASPWKLQSTIASSKSSLRSIMAEAGARSQSPTQRPNTPTRIPEPSRLPLPRESNTRGPIAPTTSAGPSTTPTNNSLLPFESSRGSMPRSVSFNLPTDGSIPSPRSNEALSNISGPQLQSHKPPSAYRTNQSALGKGNAPLGPTFVPTRHTSQSQPPVQAVAMGRKTSDSHSKAWTSTLITFPEPSPPHRSTQANPNMQPAASSSTPPTRSAPVSFLAIQQEQHELASSSKAPPKSLIEIQAEEERRAEEERELARLTGDKRKAEREEAEFLRWWKREEGRIRRETKPVIGPPVGRPGRGRGQSQRSAIKATERVVTAEAEKKQHRGRGRGAKMDANDQNAESIINDATHIPSPEAAAGQPQQRASNQRPRRPRHRSTKGAQLVRAADTNAGT